MAEATKPTPGEITVMAGGAVALVASFLDFVGGDGFGYSSWSSNGGFPLSWLIMLFAVLVAVQVVLARFANLRTDPKVAGLTWLQIDLMFGFFAVVLVIAWLVADTVGDLKIGFWGMAIGAIAVFVGTILMVRESTAAPGTPPPATPPPTAPPAA
jgi:hypothetical protein